MTKKRPPLRLSKNTQKKKRLYAIIGIVFLCIGTILFITNSRVPFIPAKAQLAQPNQPGKFVIFGTAYTGDGLAPGWLNGSLFNGVNTWNITDKEQFYAGIHSLSWAPAAPFERGWIVANSPPTPLELTQYTYLNFYARSTEIGQRLEIGFSDASGNIIGNFIPFEGIGPPLQPDRWQLYSAPITQFGATGQVYGLVFRDMNGAPQKKIYMDEIELSINPGTQPLVSVGLGQPGTPTPTPKPRGPYYPAISPWVFILPGIIIIIAIIFE